MRSIVVGTAGHIDHGKTALVKALTGIDADRLEEEKRRGITIDLGFAHLTLPAPDGSPIDFSFVDVPGHERFVRNMLAGAGGIDLVLLVVAADESIKPQTREHFQICRLLAVPRGITVLTKCDLVDPEALSVVRGEVAEFVRGSFLDSSTSPMVVVSSHTGEGLDELRGALATMALSVPPRNANALFRLPVDRAFAMKGFGTVVTGTAISGRVNLEDEVATMPGGNRLRVRGIEVHGETAHAATAGQRAALNLPNVAKDDLARGMVLTTPGALASTVKVDAKISLLEGARPLKHRARVHLHSFTAETVAEVLLLDDKHGGLTAAGGDAYVQLRLAAPVLTLPGDRFIIRQFSPVVTIGGGVVLDSFPRAKKQSPAERIAFLNLLERGVPEQTLLARISRRQRAGLAMADAQRETGWTMPILETTALKLSQAGEIMRAEAILVVTPAFAALKDALLTELKTFHEKNRLAAGIGKEVLRERLSVSPEVLGAALDALIHAKKIEVTGETIRLAGHGVRMDTAEAAAMKTIETAFARAGLAVPSLKEVLTPLPIDRIRVRKLMTLLLRDRVLVKISDELVFHSSALDTMRAVVTGHKAKSSNLDVPTFKALTGVSRKYAIPLLEWLDRERVTRRVGDQRIIL